MNPARPLAGLRVVEAGIALAGPFCGSLLADFGAQVVKVERPDGGDPARLLGPRVKDVPLWWGVASRDKQCVALDLKAAGDRERFLQLIADADVLVMRNGPASARSPKASAASCRSPAGLPMSPCTSASAWPTPPPA